MSKWRAKLEGMDTFDVGDGILELQKEDTSSNYESDDLAWEDFINILLSDGDAMNTRASRYTAVRLLENWRPHMHKLARGGKKHPRKKSPKCCPGCGAGERIDAVGYTNLAPYSNYCVDCITRAMKEAI